MSQEETDRSQALAQASAEAEQGYHRSLHQSWISAHVNIHKIQQDWIRNEAEASQQAQKSCSDAYIGYWEALREAVGSEEAQKLSEDAASKYQQVSREIEEAYWKSWVKSSDDCQKALAEAQEGYGKDVESVCQDYLRAIKQAWAQVDV